MPGEEQGGSELHLPPDARHLTTARVFVAALGRHVGLSEERVEDLRLAVSEACANVLEDAPDGVTLSVTPSPMGLAVTVRSAGGGRERAEDGGAEDGWGIELIRNLADGVAVEDDAEGRTISFLLPSA
jgi:anti-sigma regulatory factor (Ser/Thr protein kinase)